MIIKSSDSKLLVKKEGKIKSKDVRLSQNQRKLPKSESLKDIFDKLGL